MAGRAGLELMRETLAARKAAERQLQKKNRAVPFTYRDVSAEYEISPTYSLQNVATDLKRWVSFSSLGSFSNRDAEGSPPDVCDQRHYTKRSRALFQRRLMIRKMGWLENNAYLTKLALEAKAEYVLSSSASNEMFRKTKGRDEKYITAETFHPRVIPPYPKKAGSQNQNSNE